MLTRWQNVSIHNTVTWHRSGWIYWRTNKRWSHSTKLSLKYDQLIDELEFVRSWDSFGGFLRLSSMIPPNCDDSVSPFCVCLCLVFGSLLVLIVVFCGGKWSPDSVRLKCVHVEWRFASYGVSPAQLPLKQNTIDNITTEIWLFIGCIKDVSILHNSGKFVYWACVISVTYFILQCIHGDDGDA